MKILIVSTLLPIYVFANIGTVMALKGEAKIKRSDIMNAKTGMDILQGDKILTSFDSKMQVILKDETVITIGEQSSFDFEKFHFDGTKNSTVALKANKGSFRTVTGHTGKVAPSRFKVKTLTATIGIRGTDFSVNIVDGKEIIKCHSGAIWVKYNDGEIKHILADTLLTIDQRRALKSEKLIKPPPVAKAAPPPPPPPPPPLTH